jgi:predicted DNA-binding transcriptional regulator AlpA
MPKQAALPPTLAPRLITREAAAAYCCLSPTSFDVLVTAGKMPKPKILGPRRHAWDVRELDAAIDLLPTEGDDANTVDTSWDDIDAAQEAATR